LQITYNLLTPNPYSRSQKPIGIITAVAIHYVGNAGTTALNNRNYFNNLKDTHSTYASSHYIVGLQGEIIQCIPENEISYCTSEANPYTISIENCHPLDDGKFNDLTYKSLVELCADICKRYGLNPLNGGLLRHYDVTKKICPRYFVEHPESWTKFKQDVNNLMNGNTNINTNGGVTQVAELKIDDKFNIKSTATTYFTGQNIAEFAKTMTHTVSQIGVGKVLSKEVMSWFKVEDCINLTVPVVVPTPPPVDTTDYKTLYNNTLATITEKDKTIATLTTDKTNLNNNLKVVTEENANLQKDIVLLKSDIVVITKAKDDLNSAYKLLSSELINQRFDNGVLINNMKDLEEKSNTLRVENEQLNLENTDLQKEIEDLNNKLNAKVVPIQLDEYSIGDLIAVLVNKIFKKGGKE
jgi:N-acetylmuramoyl-L-alanine amidase